MSERISKIVQIVINIIAIVNMFLQAKGKTPISAEYDEIYSIVSLVVLVAVICYDTYRNFDVTQEGKLGTKITRALKKGTIENDKVKEILEEQV